MGPNVKRLIIKRMCLNAVPQGGGLADAISFLTQPENMIQSSREAARWVEAAIQAVRLAAEPNPWKNASDEEIAGEILLRISASGKGTAET